MIQRRIRADAAAIDVDAIRAELGIPAAFPTEVEAEAGAAAGRGPWIEPERTDRTALPLVTLDPPGSRDLDQAVLITARPDGYLVHYAIADVAAWPEPAGPVDRESFVRGATVYGPDKSTPLHPRTLSEGAASLLPGLRRPAVLWSIELDRAGRETAVRLERAWVCSTAQLDYPSVAADVDTGTVHPSIALLPDVGRLRQALSRQRHAITLDLPEIDVIPVDGGWRLERRAVSPIEQYNAEISLLTGMCAAKIMLDGRVGILRTLPEPGERQIAELRRSTAALGIPWPPGAPPGDVIAGLDGADPKQAAFLEHAAKLLRGAAYHHFAGELPERTRHAGVGAPYAHVTAPLRRLVDRFGTEVCLALHAGRPVPTWAGDRLDELGKVMAAADQRANSFDKACVGAVGALLLHGREGDEFTGTVLAVDREKDQAVVVLDDPPVRARCASDDIHEGDVVQVELVSADPATHTYHVRLAGPAAGPNGWQAESHG